MRMRRGECYFDSVVRFYLKASLAKTKKETEGIKPRIDVTWFCWMCQLNTFLQLTGGGTLSAYNMIELDAVTNNPYQRYAAHTSWELIGLRPSQVLLQGLCRALGDVVVSSCNGVKFDDIDSVTFSYFGYIWSHNHQREKLHAYTERFRAAERESREEGGA
jgi:hypothetical protein